MSGVQAGVIAFVLWGLVPLFWHLLHEYDPWELVAHRALWSLPLLLTVLAQQRRSTAWIAPLRLPQIWLTSLLLSGNWLLYVWLAVEGRLIEASLAYFIVPLFSTLLGVRYLGETLRPLQRVALVLAGSALLFPLADLHYFPWESILIAVLWSGYGFVRKRIGVESLAALTAETIALFPVALGFLLLRSGFTAFAVPREAILLVLTGGVTVLPLLFYGYAVPRLALTQLGLLQYLGPLLTFLFGVFLGHEPLPWHRVGLMAMVLLAIAVYVLDGLRERRSQISGAA